MNVVAFWLIALMLTVYVVLDGYDLGVAIITPFVARTGEERLAAMRTIGPFWNGNEVWLIATGAVLFAIFPQAYASAFSGFYLPFIVVLWLLMVRGTSLELRGHFPSRIWHDFWDACFFLASILLVLLFGVTLGNLLRGLPLDVTGFFLGTFALLLNPYALTVGIFAIAALAMHGAAFLTVRLVGAPAKRAAAAFGSIWLAVGALYVVTTVWTFTIRGGLAGARPFAAATIVLSVAAFAVVRFARARERDLTAFLASTGFLATLLVAAAGTVYPYLLPGRPAGMSGISIDSSEPSMTGVIITVAFTVVGLLLTAAYATLAWRYLGKKVRV